MNSKLSGMGDEVQKESLPFSPINMKTKVARHVPRIAFQISKFPGSQLVFNI